MNETTTQTIALLALLLKGVVEPWRIVSIRHSRHFCRDGDCLLHDRK